VAHRPLVTRRQAPEIQNTLFMPPRSFTVYAPWLGQVSKHGLPWALSINLEGIQVDSIVLRGQPGLTWSGGSLTTCWNLMIF